MDCWVYPSNAKEEKKTIMTDTVTVFSLFANNTLCIFIHKKIPRSNVTAGPASLQIVQI